MTHPHIDDAGTIGCLCLTVSSLNSHCEWYQSVLGLDVLERTDTMAFLGVESTPLIVFKSAPTLSERPVDSAGLFHVAFRVPTRAALGTWLKRVTAQWQLDGAADHLVSEALYLHDPDGNGIELYYDTPRETWPIDEQGMVRMETLPLDLDSLTTEASETDRLPPETTIGHVHLEVTDLDRSTTFYTDVMGLNSRDEHIQDASFLAFGEYHHHLGLNRWRRRSRPITGVGLDWFEFVVPSEQGLSALTDRLESSGYHVTELDPDDSVIPGTPSRIVEVSDPDGITVRLRF